MAERMTVVIRGQDGLTVEDAMRQVLETFELVARADPSASGDIEWRLVSASTNSPLTVVAEASATRPGVDAERVAKAQKAQFRQGISDLRVGKNPSQWKSPDDRRRAKSWLRRTHRGIAETRVDTGASDEPISVTVQDALIAEPTLDLPPHSGMPRQQVGSIEGFLTSVETHYHKPAIIIRDRKSGAIVRCIVPEEFRSEIAGEAGFEDVWRERRVVVHGRMHYDDSGKLDEIVATMVSPLPRRIVDVADIKDPEFTAGLPAEQYIDQLREGDID